MRDPLHMNQALVLVSEANRSDVAEALWTMFGEVSALWNAEEQLARFDPYYVGEVPAPGIADRSDEHQRIPLAPDGMAELLAAAPGAFASTIDQAAFVRQIRSLVAARAERDDDLIVVTDQELTPPTDWRYILWQHTESGWIVSTAPMDPDYWGYDDPQRVRKIKHRTRAACMLVIGTSLGLKRCRNPQCFMFERVDSVIRLDVMRGIGGEHDEFPPVESVGFSPIDLADPRDEHPLAKAAELTIEGWPSL